MGADSDVRATILEAIGATDDNDTKAVLLLMLGVLESVGKVIESRDKLFEWVEKKMEQETQDEADERKNRRAAKMESYRAFSVARFCVVDRSLRV